MKRIIYFVFAAAALLAVASCSGKYETVAGDPMDTKIYTLDNGLKVFMTVNKETPRIQTYVAVKVGAKNDPLETTGLAHYFEHLMFKGTEQFGTSDYAAEKPMLDEIEQLFEIYRQTTDEAERAAIYHKIDSVSYEASKIAIPNEYDKLMSFIGAEGTNAWTSDNETVYTEDIPSNQIDNWARVQADRFQHPVLRGFHTELETIYEEKNMSLTDDSDKMWMAIQSALFPHHPSGIHDVLGFQDHLKNPSIVNVKKYHDQYYVPNNIAICVSGDFDPDEMVATIEKYFGQWQPNPDLKPFEYAGEDPITEPIVKDVYGLEAENVAIVWPIPAATDLESSAAAEIASYIIYNGQAGLMDIDLNQQQKVLSAYAGDDLGPDYGMFIAFGDPREGQSLDEVRDLILGEVAKLRNGEFSDELITATINNIKLSRQRSLESNSSRAHKFVRAFINGIDWKDACKDMERLEAVTKEDVVAWAGKYLTDNGYVVVNKRQGVDESIQKVSKPEITPIVTNRDNQSDFLTEIQNIKVKPVEPKFVDFEKEMEVFNAYPNVEVLYKKNEMNDLFDLSLEYNVGAETDPALSAAISYIQYLGTETMSAQDIAVKMYDLACSFYCRVGANKCTIGIEGLGENMSEALKIVKDLMLNAKPDEAVLASIKADVLKSRADRKLSQGGCANALRTYMYYGPEYVKRTTLDNKAVMALKSEDLLAKVASLLDCGCEVIYYGPQGRDEFLYDFVDAYDLVAEPEAAAEKFTQYQKVEESNVVMAQYDSPQIYYYQYSDRGETFRPESEPALALYNEYFGGGMNTIVFQEMREARGLAYSAWARLLSPSFKDQDYIYVAFIATQNDKMKIAIEAFDEIINNMPESDAAFEIAKEGALSRLRTSRTTRSAVLGAYLDCRRLGIDEPLDKVMFEKIQNMTFEDIAAIQKEWVKDRKYTYAILGDIKDLDVNYLKTLGPVKTVKLEEIFGY